MIDTNHFSRQYLSSRYRIINIRTQSRHIVISRAGNNTAMVRFQLVQLKEIAPIDGQSILDFRF